MRHFIRHCLIVLLMPAFAGCISMARRLEVSAVRPIQIGSNTIAEVEKKFGAPAETVTGANGKTVARYFFRELHRSTDVSAYERREHLGDILLRTLSLRYGASGVIEQKLHDESLTPIRRYNAYYLAGPTLTSEALVNVQTNVTTERALIELLGEPASRTFDTDGSQILIWYSLKARRDFFGEPEVRELIAIIERQTFEGLCRSDGNLVDRQSVVSVGLRLFRRSNNTCAAPLVNMLKILRSFVVSHQQIDAYN